MLDHLLFEINLEKHLRVIVIELFTQVGSEALQEAMVLFTELQKFLCLELVTLCEHGKIITFVVDCFAIEFVLQA